MNEFYVGYLPAAPPGVRRRVRIFVAVSLVLAVAGAILFAASQRHFANSRFEFGKPRDFVGIISRKPILTLSPSGDTTSDSSRASYLLCAPGKHGADSLVSPFAGKTVHLRGTLISRDEGQMIEVIPDSITERNPSAAGNSQEKDLGEHTLAGEIVDTKCFLGVMNPGEGKVHRECAALCLRGGIPPALFTRELDGSPKIVLLIDQSGAPMRQSSYLQRVGQPVLIHGHTSEFSGLYYLRTTGEDIAAIP